METIFPFLWVTGKKVDYQAEIAAIAKCGIKSFCVESRVHPDFCGDGWWEDFDEILRCAEQYDMTVWILDDKHYPTGNANDQVAFHPHLQQRRLIADNYDFVSDGFVLQTAICPDESDVFLAAFAIPHTQEGLDFEHITDLTACAKDGWLLFTLPKGEYRIVLMYTSYRGVENNKENFIDMLNPASVDLLLQEVHEKFYARYAPLFGNRIVGFFSDEPRLCDGNSQPRFNRALFYEHTIGLLGGAYPYSQNVYARVQERIPDLDYQKLLGIWYETKGHEELRCAYMEAVTQEYAVNFSSRVGAWCKAHGVAYAGHIVEDMNAHTHSGCSAGHYFRSQAGQDLAGIDVVLHQMKPYYTDRPNVAHIAGGYACPKFFLDTMPALAVSDAWLDDHKQGSVCELFGAFGWGESVRDMKWTLDVLLASGVDHFIPHAFCPELGNNDCPPHFYEGGRNPQYEPFAALMGYTNRVLPLLQNKYKPTVGVLYHAEAEWSGKDFSMVDGICRKLNEQQIPFMIVPYDKLEQANLQALIVPYYQFLPAWVEDALQAAQQRGVAIYHERQTDYNALRLAHQGVCKTDGTATGLRILNGENPMFFQIGQEAPAIITTDKQGPLCLYDPMNETYEPIVTPFTLQLKRGETRILLTKKAEKCNSSHTCPLPTAFTLSKKENDEFVLVDKNVGIGSVNTYLPDYSGTLCYACSVTLEEGDYEWEFPAIGGCLQLEIDNQSFGYRFAAPAKYRMHIRAGAHTLRLYFSNTLANVKRDMLSAYKEIEAFGLLAAPILRKL